MHKLPDVHLPAVQGEILLIYAHGALPVLITLHFDDQGVALRPACLQHQAYEPIFVLCAHRKSKQALRGKVMLLLRR